MKRIGRIALITSWVWLWWAIATTAEPPNVYRFNMGNRHLVIQLVPPNLWIY